MVWHAEELDAHLSLAWRTCIACQALCPREPKVRPLRPRKDRRRRRGATLAGRIRGLPHLDVLSMHQLHTGAPVLSATPISPEQRCGTNDEGMQEHTDLAWLFGGVPIPLALFTQLTGTTTANTGRIHQPQDPISLLPPLLEGERAACGTAQSSIGLERKIVAREATCFPGRGRGG
jgi:hypothetical protein